MGEGLSTHNLVAGYCDGYCDEQRKMMVVGKLFATADPVGHGRSHLHASVVTKSFCLFKVFGLELTIIFSFIFA